MQFLWPNSNCLDRQHGSFHHHFFIQPAYHGNFNSHSRLTSRVLSVGSFFDSRACILIGTLFGKLLLFHFIPTNLTFLQNNHSSYGGIFSHSNYLEKWIPLILDYSLWTVCRNHVCCKKKKKLFVLCLKKKNSL